MSGTATRFGALLDAVDYERSCLGARLHDTIVQNLAAISIQLSALLESSGSELQARNAIQECAGLVEESIRELRDVSAELNPIPVPELDLAACVETIRQFAASDGISLRVEMTGLNHAKANKVSRDALVRITWDFIRSMSEQGVTEIHLRVRGAKDRVRARLEATVSPQAKTADNRLSSWIVQERVGRLGGEAHIDLNGDWKTVEFTIPSQGK